MTLQKLVGAVILLLLIGTGSNARLTAISGGTPISALQLSPGGDFEWLVRLQSDEQVCSGSLVAADWVLTNAHCGDARHAFVGDDTAGVEIVEVIMHPQFREGELQFDAALLRLATPSRVRPVSRAASTINIAVGQELTLAGWGRNDPGAPSAVQPSSAVAIVEGLDSTLIQTGASAVGCAGDSGGPALLEGFLAGVMVASDDRCNAFTVSVRFSNIAAWVASIAGSGPSEPPPSGRDFELTVTAGQPFEIEFEMNAEDELTDVSTEGLLVGSCTEDFPLVCQFMAPFGPARDIVMTYTVVHLQRATETRWTIHVLADFGPPAVPVAQDGAMFALPGVPRAVSLLAADGNGDPLTFEIVTPPAHGVLSDCTTGICAYTSHAGYAGPDRFTWRASDGRLVSNVAAMSIDVQPAKPPIVAAGLAYTLLRTPVETLLEASDPNGDPIVYTIVTQPLNGRLTRCVGNVCVYTPNRGFLGTDSFTWLATDGNLSSAPVTFTIEVMEQFPPFATDGEFTGRMNGVNIFDLPAFDPEGDRLTLTLLTMPKHGTLSCNGLRCSYRPQLDFAGADSFTWQVSDGLASSRHIATAFLHTDGSLWSVRPLSLAGTAHALAVKIAGPGSRVSNAVLTGSAEAAGAFTGAADAIGLADGVILSTGTAVGATGPNRDAFMSAYNDMPGDPDLPAPSFDAVSLSFDFVPTTSTFTMRYRFGSEEYPSGVGLVDEAAAIFVNGANCALVGGEPVGTKSINHGNDELGVPASNPELLISNDGTIDTEMNALTVVLTCTAPVVPGRRNHVKIVIADNLHDAGDSTLFIEGTTFVNTPPTIAPPANVTLPALNAAGAPLTFIASGNDDEDGVLAAACLPASGSVFPIGQTTVTCTVTDRDGSTADGSFEVTVTEPATPGNMSGDGFVRDAGTRYQFSFDARENDRGERAKFSLRISPESPKGKGKDRDDRFASRTVTFIAFSDDPNVDPRRRRPQIDTVLFSGIGEWNGKPGFRYEVAAQDEAGAGRRHRESIRVTVWNAAGEVVAGFSGEVGGGTIRSKRLKH